jgi:MYXO-CTERM domain-containing protein
MKRRFAVSAAALALSVWAGSASAIVIQYTLTDIGLPGTDYRYVFNVINNGSLGAGVAVEWFDIEFPSPNYLAGSPYDEASLAIVTGNPPASAWTEQILGSVPALQPATYDAAATGAGIADGASQSGFAVEFDWLGAGVPGAQEFNIWDPVSGFIVESGWTVEAPPAPTPAPAPLALLGLGLGLLVAQRRR